MNRLEILARSSYYHYVILLEEAPIGVYHLSCGYPKTDMPMSSLSEFIRKNREPILVEWEAFARTCKPAANDMNVRALRDHAGQMLTWIANDLETAQTDKEGDSKAKGGTEAQADETVASKHGEERYQDQFTLPQIFAEFRVLRATVINLWTKDREITDAGELRNLIRFNEAIDQLVAESAERFAERLGESRDLFAAVLGHDLRNPLSAIITCANYLQTTSEPGTEASGTASRILTSGNRMGRLITDILDFSRSRLGGDFPISPREMNLEKITREIVDEVVAGQPERVVTVESSGNVSGTWDRERVGQVISNLVANAVQHGDPDTDISVRLQDDDDEVMLSVHNWGPVISSQDQTTIFDPVKRLGANEGDTKYQGSLGLGLHIVQLIVVAHGGSVEVDSSKSKGTTFAVCLPKCAASMPKLNG